MHSQQVQQAAGPPAMWATRLLTICLLTSMPHILRGLCGCSLNLRQLTRLSAQLQPCYLLATMLHIVPAASAEVVAATQQAAGASAVLVEHLFRSRAKRATQPSTTCADIAAGPTSKLHWLWSGGGGKGIAQPSTTPALPVRCAVGRLLAVC